MEVAWSFNEEIYRDDAPWRMQDCDPRSKETSRDQIRAAAAGVPDTRLRASSHPTIHTATQSQTHTHTNDDHNGMKKHHFNILAQTFLAKTRQVEARFGIARVVWYNDEAEERKRRESWTNHTSHPERDCISIIFISFFFCRWIGVFLAFRNRTRSNTGRCLFFVWRLLFPFSLGGSFWLLDWKGSTGSIGFDWMVVKGTLRW
jgi:hypothetical protein